MARIEFPSRLEELLKRSPHQAPLRLFADRVGTILADNKLPFFPSYTDHGVDHVNRVLQTEVDLVPEDVWKRSRRQSDPRILNDVDGVVLVAGTLLHDIAMHIRVDGFLELVAPETRWLPVPWFDTDQEGHSADTPWFELWSDYQQEAKRFGDRTLAEIVGEEVVRSGWRPRNLSSDSRPWNEYDHLIVGEFLRRNHARLAHEIAIYGFPGLNNGNSVDEFPALADNDHPLADLSDLVGLVARSHGTSLRVCKSYLDEHPVFHGQLRPMGTTVLYSMALLRIADYLQLEYDRAPSVLLRLRRPQSPASIDEWSKHRAVRKIGPAQDPRGRMVAVGQDVPYSTFLQLDELLANLQQELDHSVVVIDEAYSLWKDLGLDRLRFEFVRIQSNIWSPEFRRTLPYLPYRTGISVDPTLLGLLVEPLYGGDPSIGVRELIQNATDAVRELHAWCDNRNTCLDLVGSSSQNADVLAEFVELEEDKWLLRVSDKGIGMTAETLTDYYLRAGASFRKSDAWAREFISEDGRPRVLRAGRFGVGVFASFLLGPRLRVYTRHVGESADGGFYLELSLSDSRSEVRKYRAESCGTVIEVELSESSVQGLGLRNAMDRGQNSFAARTNWFFNKWPSVERRVLARGKSRQAFRLRSPVPDSRNPITDTWIELSNRSTERIFWHSGLPRYPPDPRLVHNGIRLYSSSFELFDEKGRRSEFRVPRLSIVDPSGTVDLDLTRSRLVGHQAFREELWQDVLLSTIAFHLVLGPRSFEEMAFYRHHHMQKDPEPPLSSSRMGSYWLNCLKPKHYWYSSEGFVPNFIWPFSILNRSSAILFDRMSIAKKLRPKVLESLVRHAKDSVLAAARFSERDDIEMLESFHNLLGKERGTDLASAVIGARLVISVKSGHRRSTAWTNGGHRFSRHEDLDRDRVTAQGGNVKALDKMDDILRILDLKRGGAMVCGVVLDQPKADCFAEYQIWQETLVFRLINGFIFRKRAGTIGHAKAHQKYSLETVGSVSVGDVDSCWKHTPKACGSSSHSFVV